ncbi:MAG: T9SS type A sorting domain-containing protein, partial [Bacteroidota bacterium]
EAGRNVSVYPNPVSSKATVSISGTTNEKFSFVVYDMVGNMVRSYENLSAGSFTFDREGLLNGVYLYEVRGNDNSVKNGKIVLN